MTKDQYRKLAAHFAKMAELSANYPAAQATYLALAKHNADKAK